MENPVHTNMENSVHTKRTRRTVLIVFALFLAAASALILALCIHAGSGTYKVRLVDPEGGAVPGGTVQFARDGSAKEVDAGENGVAVFRGEGRTYGVHVLSVPDGYLNDPSKSYQVGPDKKTIRITIRKIESAPIHFVTTDISGNTVSSDDYAGAELIMINYWEPWCAPCLAEMPDLEELYEKYKGEGLVILGVYSDTTGDAEKVVSDNGITYPVLHTCDDLQQYATMAVPTTVFVSGEGKVLSAEAIVGAKSYAEWEEMIRSYLQDAGENTSVTETEKI